MSALLPILVNNGKSESGIRFFSPKNRNMGHRPFYPNRPNSIVDGVRTSSMTSASARTLYWNLATFDWDHPPRLLAVSAVRMSRWEVRLRPPHMPSQWTMCSNCLCMGVTAHWLDDNFGTHNKCMAVHLGPGSHTADFIWHNSATAIRKGIGLMNAWVSRRRSSRWMGEDS